MICPFYETVLYIFFLSFSMSASFYTESLEEVFFTGERSINLQPVESILHLLLIEVPLCFSKSIIVGKKKPI